jgi:RNA polymerase sigma factor (sigma-70 family)
MSSKFDRTIDNRWRPDLESSQRRVREEERADVHYSRELSFVPARRKAFEPYDAQTAALMRRQAELERLPHGERVAELVEKWRWIDRMKTPEEKQRFLEPKIEAVRRNPEENEDLVIFLMLAFEPVRRGVSKAFVSVQCGLKPEPRDVNWGNREEARMLRLIEREGLYDVTREGALEAVFRYPSPPPDRFFSWLRETIAHRALDKLRGDLPEPETAGAHRPEAEALQNALAGFDQAVEPRMRDRRGLREWRARIEMRDVFDVVEDFFSHDPVREACQAAVGRLPRAQREVIDGYFFKEIDVPQLAEERGVSSSTVYNQKAAAQATMHGDDVFFSALHALNRVRDRARAKHLAETYPDGVMPDGRRIVVIDSAA